MAPVIISFAFFSPSSFAFVSMSFISTEASTLISFSRFESNMALASSAVYPEIFSSSSFCLFICVSSSFCLLIIFCSLLVMLSSFLSMFSSFLSIVSSFCMSLFSDLEISFLLSFISLSTSLRSLCASSFASRAISFFMVSDLFSASRIRFLAFCSALPMAFSPKVFRMMYPAKMPITNATSPTITAKTMFGIK